MIRQAFPRHCGGCVALTRAAQTREPLTYKSGDLVLLCRMRGAQMSRFQTWEIVPLCTIDGRLLGEVRCNVDRQQFVFYRRDYSPHPLPRPTVGDHCLLGANGTRIEITGIGPDSFANMIFSYR